MGGERVLFIVDGRARQREVAGHRWSQVSAQEPGWYGVKRGRGPVVLIPNGNMGTWEQTCPEFGNNIFELGSLGDTPFSGIEGT